MCISSRGGTIPKGRSADLVNVLHVLHATCATCVSARALAGTICLPTFSVFDTLILLVSLIIIAEAAKKDCTSDADKDHWLCKTDDGGSQNTGGLFDNILRKLGKKIILVAKKPLFFLHQKKLFPL